MRDRQSGQRFSKRHLVFICSNFEEFEELREKLYGAINSWAGCPMEAVDLNDNQPESRPPLDVSLDYAGRCDVMVLLLGSNYGGRPPGERRSYSHLECVEAWSNGNPRVLPFFPTTESPFQLTPDDSRELSGWKKEIEERHTVGRLDPSLTPTDQAMDILSFVTREIYNRLTEEDRDLADSIIAADDLLSSFEAFGFSDEDLQRLERNAGLKDRTLFRDTREYIEDQVELLNKPDEAAALEKRREANKAIALGDRQAAIALLRRAFELHPMDEIVNLQLAKVLASRGIRGELREASVLASKAARMALHEGRYVTGASAYVLASQTSLEAGDLGKATLMAREAISSAGWLAPTHLQLARCLACAGKEAAALEEVERAFYLYPASLAGIHKEPEFIHIRRNLLKKKRALSSQALGSARSILITEIQTMLSFAPSDAPDFDINELAASKTIVGVMKAIHLSRESGQRQILRLRRRARELFAEWELSDRELEDEIKMQREAARIEKETVASLRSRIASQRPRLTLVNEGLRRLIVEDIGALLLLIIVPSLLIFNVAGFSLLALRIVFILIILFSIGMIIHFFQNDRERKKRLSTAIVTQSVPVRTRGAGWNR